MAEMKSVATVIGDVVGSRTSGSRVDLHGRLLAAVTAANSASLPVTPLRITVGDEFQGAFATVGEALAASWRLRLELLPETDLRVGIGWGPVQVLSEDPRVEDGPGWWAAREAIEAAAAEQEKPPMRAVRTAYRLADGAAGPDPGPVNAALIGRDTLAGGLDERSVTVLRGLLDGMTQLDIATAEAISASAVSQRVRRDGIGALLAMDDLLGAVR